MYIENVDFLLFIEMNINKCFLYMFYVKFYYMLLILYYFINKFQKLEFGNFKCFFKLLYKIMNLYKVINFFLGKIICKYLQWYIRNYIYNFFR